MFSGHAHKNKTDEANFLKKNPQLHFLEILPKIPLGVSPDISPGSSSEILPEFI